MNIESELIHALRGLPADKQQEVLDFATYLGQKPNGVRGKRPHGLCAGDFRVPDDFDAPLPDDIVDAFHS